MFESVNCYLKALIGNAAGIASHLIILFVQRDVKKDWLIGFMFNSKIPLQWRIARLLAYEIIFYAILLILVCKIKL